MPSQSRDGKTGCRCDNKLHGSDRASDRSEYDLLCADLAELYAAKEARTMAKAMPAVVPRPKPPTFVHPVPPSAFVPRPTAKKVEAPAGKPQAKAKPQIQAPALPAVSAALGDAEGRGPDRGNGQGVHRCRQADRAGKAAHRLADRPGASRRGSDPVSPRKAPTNAPVAGIAASGDLTLILAATKRDVAKVAAALRDALLTGQDTAEIRAELAKLKAAGEAIELQMSDLAAERERLVEAELAAAASRIGQDVAHRLQDLAAALTPRPAPAAGA